LNRSWGAIIGGIAFFIISVIVFIFMILPLILGFLGFSETVGGLAGILSIAGGFPGLIALIAGLTTLFGAGEALIASIILIPGAIVIVITTLIDVIRKLMYLTMYKGPDNGIGDQLFLLLMPLAGVLVRPNKVKSV